MKLMISTQHMATVAEHCQQAYPNEGCGILLGTSEPESTTVVDVLPTGNAREDAEQHNRYLIPPEALLKGELQAEERGLEVIGYFHSHPDHSAKPSEFDLEHAWPWYSYLIMSVREGKAVASRSWQLREDRSGFDEETIVQPGPGQEIRN